MLKCVPKEANLQGTIFDTTTGEVSVEAKRPWLLQRNAKEFNHAEVTEKIGWRLRIRKATTIPSRTIQTINATLKQASSERSKQLKQVGDEIFQILDYLKELKFLFILLVDLVKLEDLQCYYPLLKVRS